MSESPAKAFDCVQSMRQARDRTSAEIDGMGYEDLVAWLPDTEPTDPMLQLLVVRFARGPGAEEGAVGAAPCRCTGRNGVRSPDMSQRIVLDPKIQHGKPVVRGTRVPIVRILGGLAGGMSEEEVLREYEVTRQDLEAVYRYAVEIIGQE